MSAAFREWARNSIHECAPDHSTQLVEVGRLREASDTIAALYSALYDFIDAADEGHVSVEVDNAARAALRKARGDA